MSNETNETPVQGRKVGIARFFELLGRDLWPLYKSGILCVLGFLPGTALAVFGMMAGSALLTVVGGVVGGLVGGPFLSGRSADCPNRCGSYPARLARLLVEHL